MTSHDTSEDSATFEVRAQLTPHAAVTGQWTDKDTAERKFREWIGTWGRPVTWVRRSADGQRSVVGQWPADDAQHPL